MDSYQYLSRSNPIDISFDISSALLGSLCLVLFADLDNDFSVGVSLDRLFSTCIVDALGVHECSFDEMEQQRFVVKDGLPLTVLVECFWVFCCSASYLRRFLGFS